MDSEFQVLCSGFQIFVSGTWILDFNLPWDFGFQIPGFRDSPHPPPPSPPQKNNFVDSLTWGHLMFKEVLKCLRRTEQNTLSVGRIFVASRCSYSTDVDDQYSANIVPEAI